MGKNFYLAVFWIIDIEKKSLYNLFLQAWYQVLGGLVVRGYRVSD